MLVHILFLCCLMPFFLLPSSFLSLFDNNTLWLGVAVRWVFEEGEGELLLGESYVEDDDAGMGVAHGDVLHREPDEQILLRHPDNTDETPVAQIRLHHAVEVHSILDLGR